MNKITMIGTGHGFVHEMYNTCFVINDNFLIDTGGSADIVKNLELAGINLLDIHDVFISHAHTDYILGLFWMLKRSFYQTKITLLRHKKNILTD